jgi:hypothetical protein
MEPFVSRQIVDVLAVAFVGLAALLVGSDTSSALPARLEAGKTYCSCSCKTTDYSPVGLTWKKVATCAVNGRKCTIKVEGKSVAGTLANCQSCTTVKDQNGDVGFDKCTKAKLLGGIFEPKRREIAPSR